jgi:hypothetical protein
MLERRTSRAGRDTVDHAPNATDDLSNAAAGVVALCQARRMLKGNVFDYAAVFGGRAAPGADWRPGPGEPGDRTRPGDPGHYTSAPSGGLAVFDDQSSPRAGW